MFDRIKTHWRMVFFSLVGIYIEWLYHVAVFKEFHVQAMLPLLFGGCAGLVIGALTELFGRWVNVIVAYVLLALCCVYPVIALIYYRIFGTFLSLVSVQGAENAMNFRVVMWQAIRSNVGYILAFLMPIGILVFLHIKGVEFASTSVRARLCNLLLAVVCPVVLIATLGLWGSGMHSAKKLFHENFILELSMNKLGLGVTTWKDAQTMLFGKKQVSNYELQEEAIIATPLDAVETATSTDAKEYELQLDSRIHLTQVYNQTEDEEVKNLTAYYSSVKPTKKNAYTGLFEDYNVVFVTAESLAGYAISEECTPNLYKIMNEGIVAKQFYNPLWYHSTIDGEYVNCIGQYPCSEDWSFYKSEETYQPYALGNALKERGYVAKAYHDFDFYYYNRSKTHENMGYDFKAIDYGLEIPYYTPYSDLDTMEAVYEEFIYKSKFVMYFMSFSGHLPYTYAYNAMSTKNREEAQRLCANRNLDEECVAYIAAQMELDKALGFLMEKLSEAGKLDETLFVVAPDHYPYGLSDAGIDTLCGVPGTADDHFELHRSCVGIWSSSMKKDKWEEDIQFPLEVEKPCASVDILPTVLNLLGVTYDSRILAGADMLSEYEPLVIFSDHSFITDKVRYNAKTAETTYLVPESSLPEGYLEKQMQKVEDKLAMSDLMIDKDYYRILYPKGMK